jgi:hypothetical protein
MWPTIENKQRRERQQSPTENKWRAFSATAGRPAPVVHNLPSSRHPEASRMSSAEEKMCTGENTRRRKKL